MKIVLSLICFMLLWSCNQSIKVESVPTETAVDYAEKWEADDYGMRQYVMAFLLEGPERDQDSTLAAEIQIAHQANIKRMIDEDKLVVAGPFLDEFEVKGIYIFNVPTIGEAETLTKTDPAVKAGRLVMELHPWYGPAALMELKALGEKMEKQKED